MICILINKMTKDRLRDSAIGLIGNHKFQLSTDYDWRVNVYNYAHINLYAD